MEEINQRMKSCRMYDQLYADYLNRIYYEFENKRTWKKNLVYIVSIILFCGGTGIYIYASIIRISFTWLGIIALFLLAIAVFLYQSITEVKPKAKRENDFNSFIVMRHLLIEHNIDYRNSSEIDRIIDDFNNEEKNRKSYEVSPVVTGVLSGSLSAVVCLIINSIGKYDATEMLSLCFDIVYIIVGVWLIVKFVGTAIKRIKHRHFEPESNFCLHLKEAYTFRDLPEEKVRKWLNDDKNI